MSNPRSKKGIHPVNAVTARKILQPLSYEHGFHFFVPNGTYTGETAISLFTFSKEIENIDPESIKYHFSRGDFQNWIKSTLGDEELAQKIDTVNRQVSDENLRKELIEILKKRLSELQSVAE